MLKQESPPEPAEKAGSYRTQVENSPNKKKQTKLRYSISFNRPKQCLNFDEFDIQIDSYLNSIEGKSY